METSDQPPATKDALVSPATLEALSNAGEWVQVDKGMLSRVLYPNPVCLLTTRNAATGERNVMTITWLTPINNHGAFVCSMNCNRHSVRFINQVGSLFVLNVPVEGMEKLVLSIGGCSGATVDKFTAFAIQSCVPGGEHHKTVQVDEEASQSAKKQKLSKQELQRLAVRNTAAQCIAVQDCVAHVLCRVDRIEEDDGHLLLRCTQLGAWCREGYWDGKNFMPESTELPSFLTFLGTRVFGKVCRLDQ